MRKLFLILIISYTSSLFCEEIYIPPRFSTNIDSDGVETMTPVDNFYYRDIFIKKDYNKSSHGPNDPSARVYLNSFSGMSSSFTDLPSVESERGFNLQDRSLNQTCNIGFQYGSIYPFLANKPTGAPLYQNEIQGSGGEPSYVFNACNKNDSPNPDLYGGIKYKLSCSPLDVNHPSIGDMIDSDINNRCYFFRPCASSAHRSIMDLCIEKYPKPDDEENDEDDYEERLSRYNQCVEKFSLEYAVQHHSLSIPHYGFYSLGHLSHMIQNYPELKVTNFGEYCLYQDTCLNPIVIPPEASTQTTQVSPTDFVKNFFQDANRCTHHMNCASGLCLAFRFTHLDLSAISSQIGEPIGITTTGVHSFCSPVSSCQYNKGLEFYEVPSEGYCANIPREKRDRDGNIVEPTEFENLVKFELKNIKGESDGSFCSYPSFPLEFVGDISATVDPENCSVELVETGFKQDGNQIIETVINDFCIINRENFVGGIELMPGLDETECEQQGGSYFEGHEFVHQRYRMLTRLFNALEWLWGEASSKALSDENFIGNHEGPKIMKVYGELRREIEQDRLYYIKKRELHQSVLEQKMKVLDNSGDATNIAFSRLMIENQLEESTIELRKAQLYAMLLGFIPKNQIKNRAFFNQSSLKTKSENELQGITALFDEDTPAGKQNKIKLSKEAVVRSSFLNNNNPATLTKMKRLLIEDDKLNNCNRIGPSYGENCHCTDKGDMTLCGGQCFPENYENKKYATYYNAMCINEAMAINGDDGEPEYYIIDGVYPDILNQGEDSDD